MENESIELNSVINKITNDLISQSLRKNECRKNLILSNSLPRLLDRIITFTELKKLDVNKIFYIDNKIPKGPGDEDIEWVYIIRPVAEEIKLICNAIKEDLKNNFLPKFHYKILFSPRKLYICDLMIEQEGLFEYVVFGELQNDFVVLDEDLMSMEYPSFLTNYFLHGDQTWLPIIAKALINIQDWFGKIPKVHLHGSCSKAIYELYKRLNELQYNEHPVKYKFQSRIGQMVIIDRNVDLITPFCSPLTYEGLLNEYFKINAGFTDIPLGDQENKTKRIRLSNEDKIFEEIRQMHVSEISHHLKNKIMYMKSIMDKKNDLNDLTEMKNFISTDLKQYNQYKELVILHLNLSDIIINQKTNLEFQLYLSIEHNILINQEYKKSLEYIEELINRNFNMNQVLRLMILLSKTNNGLPSSDYQQLVDQFLRSYGNDKIYLIQKLRKISLFDYSENVISKIIPTDSKSNLLNIQFLTNKLKNTSNYGNIKKKLDIIPNNLTAQQLKSTSNQVDMSYAYNGTFRPILCRYIMKILSQEGNVAFEEITKLFPGEYEKISTDSYSARNKEEKISVNKTVLILFVGGCTFSEIAVLKKLAAQQGYKFIFATTSFLNNETIIDLLKD